MIVKTEAIVLKSFDFRETSKIVTFYTREFGKIKGVMKGVRKDPRKFGSSVDKFTVNDIVFYQYRNSDIHLISQCDMKEFYSPIRQDLKRMTAASYILELVDAILPIEQKNEDIYELILQYLSSLQTDQDVTKLVHIFQIKTLSYSGFRPHLDSCVKCTKKVQGQTRFSMKLGGLVCDVCRTSDGDVSPISRGTVASIIHIEQSEWGQTLRLGLSAAIKKELKYVLNNFLVFHLEKHLRSARFIH
jgi:DNA repair protein RecO (recombination protein O)